MKLFEIIHFLEESKANPKFYPINKQDAVVVGGAPPLAPFRVGVLHDNAHPGVPHSDVLHTNPDDNPEIVEIFSDSRKVTEDSIFCCISGKEADGHDYALSALSAGAVAVFAEKYLPECKVPQIIVNSTREWMGKVAAKIYGEPAKQLKMYAVTGTNGKTTTTWVIRSLLESIGIKCGLVGTVLQNDGLNDLKSEYTTPESCDIQRLLSRMVRNGCKACVMETSSHGLDMGRLDGCEFDVMVFNNLSPEHLDYHKTMENYFSAKCLLFDKYSKKDGKIVVNADDAYGRRIIDKYGNSLKVRSFAVETIDADYSARDLNIAINGSKFKLYINEKFVEDFFSPLVASFNVKNTLAALSAVHEENIDIKQLAKGVADTPQVPGRLEKHFIPIGNDNYAACCIIDFAHTPEALKNVLSAVREFCAGNLISVFGHGGGRYQANRPALGSVAAAVADKLIITMDNPRHESPHAIADQIAAGVASSNPDMDMKIIIDRKEAIKTALDEIKSGDVVVLSGKGHENYLIIGDKYLSYSDAGEVSSWLKKKNWDNMPVPCKLVLDSREIKAISAESECGFAALVGNRVDGHSFIKQALIDGAKFIVGKSSGKPEGFPEDIPYISLDDTERELVSIAKKYIDKVAPKEIIAITGSVGKTTTREAIKRVLESKYRVHAAERSFNTLIGCTVSILSMPIDTEVLILEFGANKPGEIRELTEAFAPTISVITDVAPVHLEGFKSIEGVLSGKMEITLSDNMKTFIYNADNLLLREAAEKKRDRVRVLSVGRSERADYRINDISEKVSLPVEWEIEYEGCSHILGAEFWGRHPILALSIAAAIGNELGVDGHEMRETVSEYKPLNGRGRIINGSGGKILIDDAYNANPASMSASVSSFLDLVIAGNKWAILGDMKELGEEESEFHREISKLFIGMDMVILIGEIWKKAGSCELPNCVCLDSWQAAYEYISSSNWNTKNDWAAMLIKGSNSHKLQELVAKLEAEI